MNSSSPPHPLTQSPGHPAITIRITLPYHLRNLANLDPTRGDILLEIPTATIGGVLEAVEARFPTLRGTIREHDTGKRRPFVRFYACKEDMSLDPLETPLPEAIVNRTEPFMIVGAMAGG